MLHLCCSEYLQSFLRRVCAVSADSFSHQLLIYAVAHATDKSKIRLTNQLECDP